DSFRMKSVSQRECHGAIVRLDRHFARIVGWIVSDMPFACRATTGSGRSPHGSAGSSTSAGRCFHEAVLGRAPNTAVTADSICASGTGATSPLVRDRNPCEGPVLSVLRLTRKRALHDHGRRRRSRTSAVLLF